MCIRKEIVDPTVFEDFISLYIKFILEQN